MPPLTGRNLLIVEDEPLVGMLLADMVEDLGGTVVAQASSFDAALTAAARDGLDLAILDVNLRGQMSYPVAEKLVARGVPIIFVTGYARETIPFALRHIQILQKPYSAQNIARAAEAVLAPDAPRGPLSSEFRAIV